MGAGVAAGIGAAGIADRVASGDRPGAGERPGTLPGFGDRPGTGDRIANRDMRRNDLQDRLASREDIQSNRQDARGERQANRQDSLGERQGNRQDARGDRQENRQDYGTDRREDWQNWADDHDWPYHDWHHGYWHGSGEGWWDHMWDEHPAAATLGLTTWGLNRVGYSFGLWGYSNPYYTEPYYVGSSVIDYSQPLIVSEPYPVEVPAEVPANVPASPGTTAAAASEPLPPGVTQPGLDAFERGRTAFYSGDYETALREIDQSAVAMPQDATVHEFRGLVLFALGRYSEAAAPVHAVLAVGPGWDWTTMVGLYPSVDVYTVQLRALERYVREHADDAPSRFLLAYHYITTGNTEGAVAQLRAVTRLRPDDTVAAELLRMLGGAESEPQPGTQTPTPTPSPSDAPQLTAKDLLGDWVAKGPRGSEYQATFSEDGGFKWTYTSGKRTESVGGVFAVDGDVLAMEPDSGGTLAARISNPNPNTLHFAAAGAPAGDPGLEFVRASGGN